METVLSKLLVHNDNVSLSALTLGFCQSSSFGLHNSLLSSSGFGHSEKHYMIHRGVAKIFDNFSLLSGVFAIFFCIRGLNRIARADFRKNFVLVGFWHDTDKSLHVW